MARQFIAGSYNGLEGMSVNQEHQRSCPLCQAQAVTLNKTWHSQPYAYRSVWARDGRDESMGRCSTCGHTWTTHVGGTQREFGRRPEGPFYPASSFFDLKPADLHLFEIAFDLGKDDEPTPTAWSYVQLMMGVDGWMSPTSSLIDTLRELVAVVEDGNDTPVFAYDFSVEPTYWHSPGEKIADTVIVKCLAGEQTCDRAWLLDRLKRLVATFEREHNQASAEQFKPLIAELRQMARTRAGAMRKDSSATWDESLIGCVLLVVNIIIVGSLGMWIISLDWGFFFSYGTILIIGILAAALFNRVYDRLTE